MTYHHDLQHEEDSSKLILNQEKLKQQHKCFRKIEMIYFGMEYPQEVKRKQNFLRENVA